MKLTRQCFILSRVIINSFSVEEVDATYDDMVEMGIAQLPYSDVDLVMQCQVVLGERGIGIVFDSPNDDRESKYMPERMITAGTMVSR